MSSERATQCEARRQRILVVDDHPMFRRGLADLINRQPGLTVCAEADGAAAGLRVVDEAAPDLVIVDVGLKDLSGIELTRQILARHPSVRILVCSMHDEQLYGSHALRAGAMGYLTKTEAPDSVLEAIRQILSGKVYLSRRMTDQLLRRSTHTARRSSRSSPSRATTTWSATP